MLCSSVWHAGHQRKKRRTDAMRAWPSAASARPICMATFCTVKSALIRYTPLCDEGEDEEEEEEDSFVVCSEGDEGELVSGFVFSSEEEADGDDESVVVFRSSAGVDDFGESPSFFVSSSEEDEELASGFVSSVGVEDEVASPSFFVSSAGVHDSVESVFLLSVGCETVLSAAEASFSVCEAEASSVLLLFPLTCEEEFSVDVFCVLVSVGFSSAVCFVSVVGCCEGRMLAFFSSFVVEKKVPEV